MQNLTAFRPARRVVPRSAATRGFRAWVPAWDQIALPCSGSRKRPLRRDSRKLARGVGAGGAQRLFDAWRLGRGRRVLVCEGRLHFYEGHSWEAVVQPLRIAAELGARVAVLTNAAGGIADELGPGTLMALAATTSLCNMPNWWRQRRPRQPPVAIFATVGLASLGRAPRRRSEYKNDSRRQLCRSDRIPVTRRPRKFAPFAGRGASDAVGMSTTRRGSEAAHLRPAGLECAQISLIVPI